MPRIRTYEVTVPPTSYEVESFALEAIKTRTMMHLHAKPETTDTGPQDVIELDVRIRSTLHPEEGGMRIYGETALDKTVNLYISSQSEEPATFTAALNFES